MAHKPKGRGRGDEGRGRGGGQSFLGQAVARYDVDELDDLGKKAKRETYVEVKRPDGTVAKARGERTFYGAFTGGFSAGYWGTVGSKEGWEPASFTSSRSQRFAENVAQVEDLMDEEDLRDHRSSHKTIATRGEFASRENVGRARNAAESAAMPGGLPRELEEDVFSGDTGRLGARLLRAGSASSKDAAPAAIADAPPAAVSTKKSYGCARPPPGYTPPVETKPEEEIEYTAGIGKRLASAMSSQSGNTAATAPLTDRSLNVELERLWRSKTDMHGVGYALGSKQASASSIPTNRRLYMSSQRGQNLASKNKAIGYGNFGTGVFDQDDYDVWEEVYDNTSDKHAHYHASLKDEDVDNEIRAAALEDVRPTKLGTSRHVAGEVLGFVDAERPDQEDIDFSRWYPPPVPRGYRGVHLIEVSPLQEAQQGSSEHKKLLEFQRQHGEERLMNPRYRAELLGERSRTEGEGKEAQQSRLLSLAMAPPPPVTESSVGAAAPLWQGVSDSHKQNLLNAIGRNFVMGAQQDMEGGSARHEPFKSDARKQKRYSRFCMALEGKASASEVLKDSAGMVEAERQSELAEFGRVYRSFRQQNPDADIAAALDERSAGPAPVLRRTVTAWTPDKLLCRRWGVPEPRPSGFSDTSGPELGAAKSQRKYAEQVQAGLKKAVEKAAPKQAPTADAAAIGAGGTSSVADPAPAASVKEGGDLNRPPKSLFTSIFGDSDDD